MMSKGACADYSNALNCPKPFKIVADSMRFLFFRKKKKIHEDLRLVICIAGDSHDMSSHIWGKKYIKIQSTIVILKPKGFY